MRGDLRDEAGINPITGKQEKQRVGNWIKVANVKNKVGTPYRTGRTLFNFPTETTKGGFSRGESLLEIMKNRGYATQRSTKFQYTGYKIDDWSSTGGKVVALEKFLRGEGCEARIEDMYQRALSHINGDSSDAPILDELSPEEISAIKKGDAKAEKGEFNINFDDPDDLLPADSIIEI